MIQKSNAHIFQFGHISIVAKYQFIYKEIIGCRIFHRLFANIKFAAKLCLLFKVVDQFLKFNVQ